MYRRVKCSSVYFWREINMNIKKKIIASFITTANAGFIFYLLQTTSEEHLNKNNSIESFISSLEKITIYSLAYILPIVLLIGLPISILIDRLLTRIGFSIKLQYFISFALHILVLPITLGVYWTIQFGSEKISTLSEAEIMQFLFFFVYTPGTFWLAKFFLEKQKE